MTNAKPIDPDWRQWPEVREFSALLAKNGYEYAFTGGAVRDLHFKRIPNDIDIAVTPTQDEIIQFLEKEQYKYSYTKLHPRTCTVRIRGPFRPFDIISISQWGVPDMPFKQQLVEYLTRNGDLRLTSVAMMADGSLVDPMEGHDDVQARRVRFLPHAAEIMDKNAVRILRFYRMHALYANGEPDPFSVSVCQKNAPYLRTIDGSQYIRDFLKWMVVPKLTDSIQLMRSHGVMQHVFPLALNDISALTRLEKLEAMTATAPDVEVRFPLLLRSTGLSPYTALEQFLNHCKFTGSGFEAFVKILDMQPQTTGLNDSIVNYIASVYGKNMARKLILFSWAQDIDPQTRAQQFLPLIKQLS